MNNQIIEIKKINNNYIVDNKDIIIVNKLIKYKDKINKRIINKLIKKLDTYHISYNIDDIEVIYNDNKYEYYKLKYLKENEIKNEVNNICKCLEDNILKKVTSYKENIEQSTIIYLYTFYHLSKEEELPLRILNHRLGESSNSLLFREIRENKGLAYDIYTNLEVTKNIKSLYIYTSVADEDIEKTLNAIDEVINKVITKEIKIGQRDLEIMKKVHKTAVISTLEDSADLCNYILHQELAEDDIFEFIKDMEGLNTLNVDRIYNVSKLVLKNPTIHILRVK